MKGAESTQRPENRNHVGLLFSWYECTQCTPFVSNTAHNTKSFVTGIYRPWPGELSIALEPGTSSSCSEDPEILTIPHHSPDTMWALMYMYMCVHTHEYIDEEWDKLGS